MQYPRALWDKIELIISDNYSSDNTPKVVEKAIAEGLQCRYIRNTANMGMDGNFVQCFKQATGKYVWLVGDNDIVSLSGVRQLLSIIESSMEYGVIGSDYKGISGTLEFNKSDDFIRYMSYRMTWISGYVINTKYVSSVEFEKYAGTLLSQVPLFLNAARLSSKNLIVPFPIIEELLKNNDQGGYNIFNVFVNNLLHIWSIEVHDGSMSSALFMFLKRDLYENFIFGAVRKYLLSSKRENFSVEDGWKIIWQHYKKEWYFYTAWLLYPIQVAKRKVIKLFKSLSK